MNILYLAHRIPYPPNKGEKIRSFHQIEYLGRTHKIHLACLVDDPQDLTHVHTLRQWCHSVDVVFRSPLVAWVTAGRFLLSGKPLSVGAFYSPPLQAKIHFLLRTEKIDRILVFSSPMAEYVTSMTHIPKLLDFVDVDSEKWRIYSAWQGFPRSCIYGLEADRLAAYEVEVAKGFPQSVFVSRQEAELFQSRSPERQVAVISNGVDVKFFSRNGIGGSPASGPSTIVFTGMMDYFPNIDAVTYFSQDIFPLIRRECPGVRFTIVGGKPSRRVRDLTKHAGIAVTGSVPDVRPYLAEASVAVAPLRIARGIQNKVLEAMSMELPVVGTSCALEGVGAGVIHGVRAADNPVAFAKEVVGFLKDRGLREQCGAEARHYVTSHHQWDECGRQLESLLQRLG